MHATQKKTGPPIYDEPRNMLGAWMRNTAVPLGPVNGVRVFVTLGALWAWARCETWDVASAIEAFEKHRSDVETAAGRRYEDPSGRPEADELYEGAPIVIVTTDDLSNLPARSKDYGRQDS